MSRRSVHEERVSDLLDVLSRLRPRVVELTARLTSAAVALSDAAERLGRFTEVFGRIAALHSPSGAGTGTGPYCLTCGVLWPCETAAALDELQDPDLS